MKKYLIKQVAEDEWLCLERINKDEAVVMYNYPSYDDIIVRLWYQGISRNEVEIMTP